MTAAVKTLNLLKALARRRGGKCLSEQYVNNKTKLLWECRKGHRWEATPFSVKVRKSWCRVCANNYPAGIEKMKELARQNGGKCISERYFNAKTKLLWTCEKEHPFYATPDNVHRGRWCPLCGKKGSEGNDTWDMLMIDI